jgi:outer membrane protein OmpA-like peptidoglycan-associated protein
MMLWKVYGVALGVLLQLAVFVGEGRAQLEAPSAAVASPKARGLRCTGVIRTRAIRFDSSNSSIAVPQSEILNEIVHILESCPERTVRIEGHTDARGSTADNLALSERRAQAVKEYLVSHGVSPERLVVVGFGGQKPIASSATAKGRALNRRVTLRFLKNPE